MKIWFDTSPYLDTKSECDGGDCINSQTLIESMHWPLGDEEIADLQAITLQHSSPLHVQECAEERWLVCNPVRMGRMAVFDTQAMILFSLFVVPLTIAQVTQMLGEWPQEYITRLVAFLYCINLLQDTAATPLAREQEAPNVLTAWMHVTNDCNLRCTYCYLHKSKDDMNFGVGRKAIDAIFRSAVKQNMKGVKLKYAGGEASLNIHNVLDLHDYALELADKHGIMLKAVILSNGVALSGYIIALLKARNISITLSLDGLGATHDSQRPMKDGKGSSTYILATIDRLLAQEVVPSITITLSRHNLVGLPELMGYILDRGLPFSLNYYRDNECSGHITDLRFTNEQIITTMRSLFILIEEQLPARSLLGSLLDKVDMRAPHRYTCGVGQNYLVIDQRGGVAKCQMEIQHTITTVEADDPLRLIQLDRRGVQGMAVEARSGCRTCVWQYWCTGGCPVVTFRATGRYDVKSPNCSIYQALIPDVLRLEALRLLRYESPVALSCV